MANLIIVCGPQAVGMMTVAESLRDKLKYNMMMNHDSIEVSDRIFGFGTPAQREFNFAFREKAFELAVKHNVDMIFTYVLAFDVKEDCDYLLGLKEQFEKAGGNFYFVELYADLDVRIARNATPHRMERKASKRDVEWSKGDLLRTAEKFRLNSNEGEVFCENHLKINNSDLEPDEVADKVIATFGLVANDKEESEYRFGI